MWTFEQAEAISAQYNRLREIAARVDAMKHKRAVAAYCRAFGAEPSADSGLDCCVIHNSLLSREQGRPWREVNYSQMRLANRLVKDFRASRLCSDFYARKWREMREGGR